MIKILGSLQYCSGSKTAVIRTKTSIRSEFNIKKDVRQGRVLPSNLFNSYIKKICRDIKDEWNK